MVTKETSLIFHGGKSPTPRWNKKKRLLKKRLQTSLSLSLSLQMYGVGIKSTPTSPSAIRLQKIMRTKGRERLTQMPCKSSSASFLCIHRHNLFFIHNINATKFDNENQLKLQFLSALMFLPN